MAAGGEGEGGGSQSLLETPTWALATVCFIFIFLGLFIEHLIHLAGRWLKRHKRTALYEATEKLKSVLMLLGFISLILNVTQRSISKICIPNKVASSMLPCRGHTSETTKVLVHLMTSFSRNRVKQEENFPNDYFSRHERHLAVTDSSLLDHCGSKGMTSLMSQEGLTQLNIFMFVLAAMQIVSTVTTMGLGRAKMKRWKTWEDETKTVDYIVSNDPERFRLTRDTTFGRRHLNTWATNSPVLWIVCFLRQFFRSVAKIDYLTLRHGFISTHMSINNSFNFRKYIQRSLEDDFKAVIGISPFMWLIAVLFLLVDVHGWNAYLWVSFLPLLMVLFIGTKLEVIVARMALQLTNQNIVVKGTPLVQPSNSFFWFSRPQLVLTLLYIALFLNAFEFSFLIWVTALLLLLNPLILRFWSANMLSVVKSLPLLRFRVKSSYSSVEPSCGGGGSREGSQDKNTPDPARIDRWWLVEALQLHSQRTVRETFATYGSVPSFRRTTNMVLELE